MKRISRQTVYRSEWITLHIDQVEMFDGQVISEYHQLEYPKESVCLIPYFEQQICLISSLRYTTGRIELELPAGFIDHGESQDQAALRELKEETGLEYDDIDHLGSQMPSNGMSNQIVHFSAVKVKNMHLEPKDSNEVYDAEWYAFKEVKQLMKKNIIVDGISLLGLYKFFDNHKE